MNNNPGDFDPKKQQGKSVTIFSTKKNTYDLPSTERVPSSYQNYIIPPRPDVAVSRGIFQTRKDYFRDDSYNNYSARGNLGFEEERSTSSYSKQVFQDFMNNEFKSQIIQFRFEMNQVMDVSLREFNEKSGKNHEVFQAVKEAVNHHSHQIEELEHKMGEFHANLSSISFKSFGEEGSNNMSLQKMQKIEYQQQELLRDFEKLKDEAIEYVQVNLEEFSHASDSENEVRTKKFVNEIRANMEEKIEKVLDHLKGKVAVLEKQIQISSGIDDPVVGKIKEEVEEKLNQRSQRMNTQIQNIKWSVGTKADEVSLKNTLASFELDKKIDQAKCELESLTAEIAQVAEKIRQENKILNDRTLECEKVYYNQSQQFKTNLFIPYQDSSLSLSPSKRNNPDYEKKISEIEKDFEEIKLEQRELGNNLVFQKIQLEKSRSSSPSMVDRTQTSQFEEAHLRKLEEMIDGLSSNIDILRKKTVLQEEEESKISDKFILPQDSSPPYHTFSQAVSSRETEKSPPGAKQGGVRKLSIHSSSSSPGHARVDDLKKSNASINQDDIEKRHSSHSSPGGVKNYKGSETTSSPGTKPAVIITSVQNAEENKKPSEPTEAGAEEEEDDDDEIEVILQIDDDGYLLDENGNYYFDKNGEKIKLDEKQIERLRHHNLIEEDE